VACGRGCSPGISDYPAHPVVSDGFERFSNYVETVDELEVVESAVRLLAAIRFTDLVKVEFRIDSRNGHVVV
jgi:predicted ATP-grasp superfamily ATP-dependent carboligase